MKHSSSKVKTLAPADIEKMSSIDDFVTYAVTESRLEQAMTETLDIMPKSESGLEILYVFDRSKLGGFIKWVASDINKEETDTLVENGLTMKDVGNSIGKKCREWFFSMEAI